MNWQEIHKKKCLYLANGLDGLNTMLQIYANDIHINDGISYFSFVTFGSFVLFLYFSVFPSISHPLLLLLYFFSFSFFCIPPPFPVKLPTHLYPPSGKYTPAKMWPTFFSSPLILLVHFTFFTRSERKIMLFYAMDSSSPHFVGFFI